jgi:hypothetical protein
MAWLAAAAAFGAGAVAQAEDWARFQIGAAIGNPRWSMSFADAGVSFPEPNYPHSPVQPGSGWKLFAGFRPLRIVGVEIQHLDLDEGEQEGVAGRTFGTGQTFGFEQFSKMHVSADASVLSAVLFFPAFKSDLGPVFDIMGKSA